jgi:hypothetical protein
LPRGAHEAVTARCSVAAEEAGRFDVPADGRHDAGMFAIDLIRTDLSTKTAAEYLEQA